MLVTLSAAIAAMVGPSAIRWMASAQAANPQAGTINPQSPSVNWVGTASGGPSPVFESGCIEDMNCDTFTLTVGGIQADWTGKIIAIDITWAVAANEYDVYVHKDSNSGPIVASSFNGPLTTIQHVTIAPSATGTGVYTVHVVYFSVVPGFDQYLGTASVQAGAAPLPRGSVRFQNYVSPPGVGDKAGEPTIGTNWKTHKALFQAETQTLRVGFDDCSSPAIATWEKSADSTITSTQAIDPFIFCDHFTGAAPNRTFVAQLAGTTSLMALTDDDGQTWLPSQGGGPSGIDHESVAAGPYHDPPPPGSGLLYPNAVYYCSQAVAAAFCSRSDDGGLTFGPSVPIYTASECVNFHGQVRVAPDDGTVYVPVKGCGTSQGLAVSEDNGLTWTVHEIPGSAPGDTDPSVGIGSDGTGEHVVYFGYDNGDDHPRIAVSQDHGETWVNDTDVGGAHGIATTVFPAVVAGDADRAAFAFHGASSASDQVWHLYVATTFDGGETWSIVDATPTDPVQRGPICMLGLFCSNPLGGDRNLFDYMGIAVDEVGRILVGYADGCIGECVNGPPNSYTNKATIARQSGGKRLFAAFDPVEPAVPGAPLVAAMRNASGVHLAWPEPDDGGSPITAYNVYRSTTSESGFVLLATTPVTKYLDTSAPAGTVFYKVTAVNALGEGPACREVQVGGGPTAAILVRFTGVATNSGVILRWRTAQEADLVGFNLYRGSKKLNRTLIPPKHSGRSVGASYRFLDRTHRSARFIYRLEAVRRDGSRVQRATKVVAT